MTPNEICVALMAWERGPGRRVAYVEQDGPRHTWTLHEGPTQVGHVRLRQVNGWTPEWWWTVETSRGIAREAIGLHDGGEEASR
jgi:hypothetical protein